MENCMKTDEVIDYAMPMMKIQQMLRKAHDLCLEHHYAEAREVALQLGAEARILQHTLSIMEDGPMARAATS
jgi:hypothetical protein